MAVQKQIDFNSMSNYKNCSKKSYDAYVCMPPKKTVVLDKMKHADAVTTLGNKTYFTAEQIESMERTNPQALAIIKQCIAQRIAYEVTDATPFVICGTSGELFTISANELADLYTFLQNNQPLPINQQTLNQRLHGNYLDWTAIKPSYKATAGQSMACFVPVAQKAQIQTIKGIEQINAIGTKHGKGDFIVCPKLPNGQPNLAYREVVNGEIFAATYNNQGWTDCINVASLPSLTIDKLPRLISQQAQAKKEPGIDANIFKQKCDTLMKELQKVYKFEVKSNTYEAVQDYRGFAQEITFPGSCYVAKYVVGGNFSDTKSGKTITASETHIWFGCSAEHKDSSIAMSIRPITEGLYLSGWPFPDKSNTQSNVAYWSCKAGTIADINCAEEVKTFVAKCAGRDAFIDNREKDTMTAIHSNGLFNQYLGVVRSRCCKTTVKPDSTITVVSDVTTLDKLPQYREDKDLKSLVTDVKRSYNHFLKDPDITSDFSNTGVFLKNCLESLKKYKQFTDMPIEKFYKDIILKAEYKYCFYTAAKATKDAAFERPEYVLYIPIEFKDIERNEECCLIIKISSEWHSLLEDCYNFTLIKANTDYIDTEFEHAKSSAAAKRLLSPNEKFYKELLIRGSKLNVLNKIMEAVTEYNIDPSWRDEENGVSHNKSYISRYVQEQEKLGYLNLDGFYTSEINAKATAEVRHHDLPSGNFLIGARLFTYALCEAFKHTGKFFSLHPIKTLCYEEYNGNMRCIISLKDTHFYQVYGSAIDNRVVFQMGYNSKVTASFEASQSMCNECYAIIDAYEKHKGIKERTKLYSSKSLYENLSETKLYKNIRAGIDRFTKPRKPSVEECRAIFREVCNMFSNKTTQYGLNILKPFNSVSHGVTLDYDDITIDGDNDNHLTLHFKLDVSTQEWGIKISGRTNNKVLNYTHILVTADDTTVSETDIDELTTTMIEQDICEYLGVSKWKKFFNKNFLSTELPFKTEWPAAESNRRLQVLAFSSPAFNAQFKVKCEPNALVIQAKARGMSQIAETRVEGDITSSTVTDIRKAFISLAINGVKDETSKAAISAILSYQTDDTNYTDGKLLRYLTEVKDNTLIFNYDSYNMSSSVLPDGTVSSMSECIGEKYQLLSIADFPQAVHCFANMSYYYMIR